MRTEDPRPDGRAIEWILSAHPDAADRIDQNPLLRAALDAVAGASPWLARVCVTDPLAIDALAGIEGSAFGSGSRPERSIPEALATALAWPEPFERLRRVRELGVLQIAARDLLGLDDLESVSLRLSALAEALLAEAVGSSGPAGDGMAVVALGKLGSRELNYASDIDLILVAPERSGSIGSVGSGSSVDPRPFLELARAAWRVDLDLRPEGRAGAMIRSLASYRTYWARWAEPWEFQALLKARPVAGEAGLGSAFAQVAAEQVWGRPFAADELRQLRRMKARSEQELTRRNLLEREIKRGRGGIRDIEFAVQLLQLVHGRSDPALRAPATLDALGALAAGGYVDTRDGEALASAYRFLRTVEHRLQLYEGQPAHTLPTTEEGRTHLARVMGYSHDGIRSAVQQFDDDLRQHRTTARSIHERLFFRPLLEVFSSARAPGPDPESDGGPEATLPGDAVSERLAAFGFADAARTGQALSELTRGFSRVSQLMHRMLPLLLDWLSASPDPDQGLFGLRILAGSPQSRRRLVEVCRESPIGARRMCQLLGTGPRFGPDLQRHPDSLAGLASGEFPGIRTREELARTATGSVGWRSGDRGAETGLRQFAQSERLRIAARDVLDLDDTGGVGANLADVADAVLGAAVGYVAPTVPTGVIAMGRLGGRELSYHSDLDLLIVWGTDQEGVDERDAGTAAETDALALVRLIAGSSPATGSYRVDLGLRPEGRDGPAARSLESYAAYYARWAQPWERQALIRSRFVAGDRIIGEGFARLVDRFVWERPLAPEDVLEIRRTKARIEKERVPAGEDPKFHLKLGPGSISDVEWTVQVLQMRHSVPAPGTVEALDRLVDAGAMDRRDGNVLREAYLFCERARNRLGLIRDIPGDSLPVSGPALSTLARSLGLSAPGLRNEYTRVTRRARKVVERIFYEG